MTNLTTINLENVEYVKPYALYNVQLTEYKFSKNLKLIETNAIKNTTTTKINFESPISLNFFTLETDCINLYQDSYIFFEDDCFDEHWASDFYNIDCEIVVFYRAQYSVTYGGFLYGIYEKGETFEATLVKHIGTIIDNQVVVPTSIIVDDNTISVTRIAPKAFYNANIKHVSLESIEYIGEEAFRGSYLETVTGLNKLKIVEKNAFAVTYVKEFDLSNNEDIVNIEENAFGALGSPTNFLESIYVKEISKDLYLAKYPKLEDFIKVK